MIAQEPSQFKLMAPLCTLSDLYRWCESLHWWKTRDLISWLSRGEWADGEAKELAHQEKWELTDQVTEEVVNRKLRWAADNKITRRQIGQLMRRHRELKCYSFPEKINNHRACGPPLAGRPGDSVWFQDTDTTLGNSRDKLETSRIHSWRLIVSFSTVFRWIFFSSMVTQLFLLRASFNTTKWRRLTCIHQPEEGFCSAFILSLILRWLYSTFACLTKRCE